MNEDEIIEAAVKEAGRGALAAFFILVLLGFVLWVGFLSPYLAELQDRITATEERIQGLARQLAR